MVQLRKYNTFSDALYTKLIRWCKEWLAELRENTAIETTKKRAAIATLEEILTRAGECWLSHVRNKNDYNKLWLKHCNLQRTSTQSSAPLVQESREETATALSGLEDYTEIHSRAHRKAEASSMSRAGPGAVIEEKEGIYRNRKPPGRQNLYQLILHSTDASEERSRLFG